jgi:hypothetical protein
MPDVFLHVSNVLPGIGLVPVPVELFRNGAELDDEVAERSGGSASPRFSRQSRSKAASSSPMMIRASEPPTNTDGLVRRFST